MPTDLAAYKHKEATPLKVGLVLSFSIMNLVKLYKIAKNRQLKKTLCVISSDIKKQESLI
jgi:hypothetical protein